jgi:iron complex transport system substrate-binding protein
MTPVESVNAVTLAAAVTLAVLVARMAPASPVVIGGTGGSPSVHASIPALGAGLDGTRTLTDARGTVIPLGDYRRIISLAGPADQLLQILCDPARVAAYSTFSRAATAAGPGAPPRLNGLGDLEAILALHPDLVLLSAGAGDGPRIDRLRSSAITVVDLGDEAGLASLESEALVIGTLLGVPTRARELVSTLSSRMAAVHARLQEARPHRRALVLMAYGTQLYGGTSGTSYHDVLDAAGLVDAAAARYQGWPQYRIEEVITLDPDLIVTATGMRAVLERVPGLLAMSAFRTPGGIVELDDSLLSDAGPGMLEAAEALFRLAYPDAVGSSR